MVNRLAFFIRDVRLRKMVHDSPIGT